MAKKPNMPPVAAPDPMLAAFAASKPVKVQKKTVPAKGKGSLNPADIAKQAEKNMKKKGKK